MEIEKHILEDKLKLFVFAGIAQPPNAPGWDCAIPQQWCEELMKMGIESPGAWFAADCTGTMAYPKLHHIGEAYVDIVETRQKDNDFEHLQLLNRISEYEGFSREKEFYNAIVKDNQVMAEIESGFADYSMLIRIFNAGFEAGQAYTRQLFQSKHKE